MPAENLEEQGLEKNPKLELAQYKFLLTLKENLNNEELKTKLLDEIKAENMAMFYEETCTDLGWTVDQQLLADMKAVNAKKIEELDAVIEDAEKNLGEMEVREVSNLVLSFVYVLYLTGSLFLGKSQEIRILVPNW
jgi:26S proteasome regulatory subunit N7